MKDRLYKLANHSEETVVSDDIFIPSRSSIEIVKSFTEVNNFKNLKNTLVSLNNLLYLLYFGDIEISVHPKQFGLDTELELCTEWLETYAAQGTTIQLRDQIETIIERVKQIIVAIKNYNLENYQQNAIDTAKLVQNVIDQFDSELIKNYLSKLNRINYFKKIIK